MRAYMKYLFTACAATALVSGVFFHEQAVPPAGAMMRSAFEDAAILSTDLPGHAPKPVPPEPEGARRWENRMGETGEPGSENLSKPGGPYANAPDTSDTGGPEDDRVSERQTQQAGSLAPELRTERRIGGPGFIGGENISIPGRSDLPDAPGTFNPPGASNTTPGTPINPFATGGKPIIPQD